MTKTEFLDTLRLKLEGEVPVSEIDSTIRYYDEYISETVGEENLRVRFWKSWEVRF